MKNKILHMLSLCMILSSFPVAVVAEAQDTTIQIVHTNDIHGYYDQTENGTIGFAVLKNLADEQGADLILDVGDTFHGQAFATVEYGLGIAELMNMVGYDAVTPGNHDWSYGAERLKELEDIGGFKLLASNVHTDSGEEFFDNSYLVKNVVADDGTKLKVGVVGVIDDAFYASTFSEIVSGLKFEEEAEEATKIAQKLRQDEKCDIVIAITHQKDCKGFVSNIKGIDAVLAGHEHIIMDEKYVDSEGKQIPVVEAGCYFNNIGVLELEYDTDKKAIKSANETVYSSDNTSEIKADDSVNTKITQIEQRQQIVLNEPVGYVNKEYPYSWEEIRTSEQPIGKLVTSAYMTVTDSDIAIENAGGIRAGLDVGEVTYKELIGISPYGNTLLTKELTGKQLIEVLKHSLEISQKCNDVYELQKEAEKKGEDPYQYSWPDNSGSVLQFSGVELKTDENNNVVVTIDDNPIDENKVYTVAMNNYIADSSDYPAIASAELQKEYCTCEEALNIYFDVISEYNTDEFATRGEVAEMLLAAAQDYNKGVVKSDILKGYEDGLLHEDYFVGKAEALVMLKRAFGSLPITNANVTRYNHDNIPQWARAELEEVFNAGVAADTPSFSPYSHVTVQQMKSYIDRALALFDAK